MTPSLGAFGAWLNPVFDDPTRAGLAADAEQLGYRAVWLGLGVRPDNELRAAELVLDATSTVAVATAILNVWVIDPHEVARSYHRLAAKHGDRLVLGVGVGHPESITGYQRPFAKLVEFLDVLDAAGVPAGQRMIGALGDRSLRLAADRCAGAHPYLTVPAHSRHAREVLGAGPLLAVEHKAVLDTDPARARGVGRPFVHRPYLGLRNYVDNLRRSGFGARDVRGGGSDRLIDALTLHGTAREIAAGLREHLDAGADHVGIQVLGDSADTVRAGFRALAPALALH